jgi:uncharacterized protein YndB with AHSA1/START domain
MPSQKDLKRLVRTRMKKTGEAYTAARVHVLRDRTPPVIDYAERAGMADARVREKTGRSWAEWVGVLDAAHASDKPHAEIAKYVSSLGTPDWWTQMVTVGYERIRGLREKSQRRGGGYEAGKSRTFAVPIATLYKAFLSPRIRRRWLPVKLTVRTAIPNKSLRVTWDDGSIVVLAFTARRRERSTVTAVHQKLADRAAVARIKSEWAAAFDRLAAVLTP